LASCSLGGDRRRSVSDDEHGGRAGTGGSGGCRGAGAAATEMPPSLVPAFSVDLMTAPGSAAFGAQWKTMEAKIVERAPLPNHAPGCDKAYDISPHAGEAGYDDSSWPKIEAKELGARRGGYVSFLWFRTRSGTSRPRVPRRC
jgi:hypothetical protein